MRSLLYIIMIISIEWLFLLLILTSTYALAVSITFVGGSRLIDQLIKFIISLIIAGLWLYSWEKFGYKMYRKAK